MVIQSLIAMTDRPLQKRSISGTRAVDAPLRVGTLPGAREPLLDAAENVVVDGAVVTHDGAWLAVRTGSLRVPAAFREVEVHLRLVFHEASGGTPSSADVFVDRVRVSDIEWRSVSAFLADGAGGWASCLLEEIRSRLGLAAVASNTAQRGA
jgi:hypothetical protein